MCRVPAKSGKGKNAKSDPHSHAVGNNSARNSSSWSLLSEQLASPELAPPSLGRPPPAAPSSFNGQGSSPPPAVSQSLPGQQRTNVPLPQTNSAGVGVGEAEQSPSTTDGNTHTHARETVTAERVDELLAGLGEDDKLRVLMFHKRMKVCMCVCVGVPEFMSVTCRAPHIGLGRTLDGCCVCVCVCWCSYCE